MLIDGQISAAQLGAFRLQAQALPGYAQLPILLACVPGTEGCAATAGAECLGKPVKFEALQLLLSKRVLAVEQGESADI